MKALIIRLRKNLLVHLSTGAIGQIIVQRKRKVKEESQKKERKEDEDDLLLLNHATGNNTREECSWQDAHELLNSSVELLEDPDDGVSGSQDEASSHGGKITTASAQERLLLSLTRMG